MVTKSILVLANSTKHHPMRCVAGRELVSMATRGDIQWRGWIRPVSTHHEGALRLNERRLADSSDPKPLDVVEVTLVEREQSKLQPENWLIEAGAVWKKKSSLSIETAEPLVDR